MTAPRRDQDAGFVPGVLQGLALGFILGFCVQAGCSIAHAAPNLALYAASSGTGAPWAPRREVSR